MASGCTRGDIGQILGKLSSQKDLSNIGTGCPGSAGVTVPGSIQKVFDVVPGSLSAQPAADGVKLQWE